MPKYLIDMPEGWGPGDCRGCKINCQLPDPEYDCPFILANAVKAEEVDCSPDFIVKHHLKNNKWEHRCEYNGKSVKLWATEE